MRFIITSTRDDADPRPDEPFDEEVFVAYMKFNEELHRAGVLVAAEGLNPGSPGARKVKGKWTASPGATMRGSVIRSPSRCRSVPSAPSR